MPGSQFGATNFAFNAGSGLVDDGTLGLECDGVCFTGSEISLTDIKDGTSNTSLVSERPLGSGQTYGHATEDASRRTIHELDFGQTPSVDGCDGSGGMANALRGERWIFGNYGNTLYNHVLVPNDDRWDCMTATQQQGGLAARSLHAGGVNVARCDGSVGPVVDLIDPDVWLGLGSRSGYVPPARPT